MEDAPKTLAEVAPEAWAKVSAANSLPVGGKAEVMSLIADFIFKSAHLDVMLAELMAQAAGPATAPLIGAIRDNARASSVSNSVLDAAIRHVLPPERAKLFRAVRGLTQEAQKPRDLFAHNLYCETPEVPDAVLLLDAKPWLAHTVTNFGAAIMDGEPYTHVALSAGRGIPRELNGEIYVLTKWNVLDYSLALGNAIDLMGHLTWALWAPGNFQCEQLSLVPAVAARLTNLNKGHDAKAAPRRWPAPVQIY